MRFIFPCLLLALIVAAASAEELTLDNLTMGKTLAGPDLAIKDLKGKVVYVVFWGTRCPICQGEIPRWETLWKKQDPDEFHFIGMEAAHSEDADIVSVCKSKHMDFQVTTGGGFTGLPGTINFPQGYLFGADGKLAMEVPRGGDFEKKIKELIKDSPGAMAGPGPYVKLAPIAAQIKSGVGLGAVLKVLAAKKSSKDAAETAEATAMFDALHAAAQEKFDSATELKTTDPLAAIRKFDKVSMQFSGDEIAKKAGDESAALKKDPAVKKEVEASAMWKQIEALNDKLKPVRGSKTPSDEAFRKANTAEIQGMLSGCHTLVQRYPGTTAAKKAQETIDQYH